MTVQVFVDTILLARHDPREMAASFPAVMWFWLPFGLLQVTAGYVSTFVAQYTGAGRPERVGPAVWQGIHFAILAGLLFLLLVPAAPSMIALGGHTEALQKPGGDLSALSLFRGAADAGHGRGQRVLLRPRQTWTVLGIEALGTAVNVVLALVLIFGRLGFPEMGIAGGRAGRRWSGRAPRPSSPSRSCSGPSSERNSTPSAGGGRNASYSAG